MFKIIIFCSMVISMSAMSDELPANEQAEFEDPVGVITGIDYNPYGYYIQRTCPYSPESPSQPCSCESDEIVISGGTVSDGSIRNSVRTSGTTWEVACVSRDRGVRMDCGPVTILCLTPI
jgi:hypothetical protein